MSFQQDSRGVIVREISKNSWREQGMGKVQFYLLVAVRYQDQDSCLETDFSSLF